MLIDIFKNVPLWNDLSQHNQHLYNVGSKYEYSVHYDLTKNQASYWMNPFRIKDIPVGRTYPHPHPVSGEPKFNIVVYLGYYLTLFLINELYKDKKDIIIEDAGAGDGKFFYYLSKLGYHNFHLIDDFTHLPKKLLDENLVGVPYELNKIQETFPTVVTNNGCHGIFPDLAARWTPSIELAVSYSHEKFDCEEFNEKVGRWGYKFLCKDSDGLSVAFARHDKYEEFMEKLKPYEVKRN